MYGLAAVGRGLLDVLAPSRCPGCGEPARAACPGCVRALELLPEPEAAHAGGVSLHAAFLYSSPLREILHAGKYRDGRSALRVASLLAAERFSLLPPPAVVVPVPLGRARRRSRGYNQAEIAARITAEVVGAPCQPWLRRVRETGSQVGRSPAARARNLAEAFEWAGPGAGRGRVWIVDDVITTGATMLAAIAAARVAMDGELCGVALARAGDHLWVPAPRPAARHRGIIGS